MDRWLETELERVWLLAQRRLHRLQDQGLRPSGGDAVAEVHAIASDRYAHGAPRPTSEPQFRKMVANAEAVAGALRPTTPLGILATALDLDMLAVDLLVISLAPHIDPGLDGLFKLIQGDYTRRGVDIGLVADLLELDRSGRMQLLSSVDADSPLVRFGILVPTRSDASCAQHVRLQPAVDFIPVLLGRAALSPGLQHTAALNRAEPGLDDLTMAAAERTRLADVVRATSRLAASATPPWIVLWGPRGIGKRALAGRIAAGAGAPLLALDTRFVAGGHGDQQLRRAQRDALTNGAVLYIGPVRGELLDDAGKGLVDRLHGFPGTLVFGVETSEPPRFHARRPVHEVAMRMSDRPSREALWQRHIPAERRAPQLRLDTLAASFKLTPGEIAAISAEAHAIDGDAITGATLRRGIDRLLRNELSNLARRVSRTSGWQDLVLPEEQRQRVRELIDRHRFADQVFAEWEMGSRVGYGRGVIALFSGPPGTGKTMLAGVIARELGLDLYKVDVSQVVSKWVGETEKQLSRIFELAERAHAVLLFDEADALLAKRTKVETSNDRHGNLAVNYMLQRFEDYDGVAILTTNRAKSLDEAVSRRLTMHLRLDIPEEQERRSLWRSFLPPTLPMADDVDLDRLARDHELAGGNIKNVAVRAAFYAASDGADVDMAVLKRALQMEMQDMGRLS